MYAGGGIALSDERVYSICISGQGREVDDSDSSDVPASDQDVFYRLRQFQY